MKQQLPSIRPKTTPANAKLSNTRINTEINQMENDLPETDLDASLEQQAFEI